jgi:hypothetical protein
MDARQLFLHQHGHVHSAAVTAAEGDDAPEGLRRISLEDLLLGGLIDEHLRLRPGNGLNSLAWLLWHMARCEDIAMNVLLADRAQVLDEGHWLQALGVSRRDIGTSMTGHEVADLSERIDVGALRGYRVAVGRRTREVVGQLCMDDLEATLPASRLRRALAEGALGSERAQWIEPLWDGKSLAWFLWLGTGHNYWHIGEGFCVRSQLGRPLEVDGALVSAS